METERKFILSGFPENLEKKDECEIFQYFLSTDPYVRVRRKIVNGNTTYKLTIKGKGTLSRTETEFDLTETEFAELSAICEYEPVKKVMKIYNLPSGLHFECSEVDPGSENSFFYGEIEFKSEEEAHAFVPEFDYVKEVTETEGYQMNRYWQKTRVEKQPFVI